MNKRLLIVAGALTAFVLVVLGGVFGEWVDTQPNQASPLDKVLPSLSNSAQAKPATSANEETSSPQINIADAKPSNPAPRSFTNEPAPVAQAPVHDTPKPTAPALAKYSANQAANIAQNLAPRARLQGTPELVRYGGRVAYEAVFDQGKIYIDANTGAVLSNGIVTEQQNQRGYEDDDDEENEHRSKGKRKHREHDDDEDEHEERERG